MLMIKRLKRLLDDRFLSLEKVDQEIDRYMQEKASTEEEFTEEYNSIIEYRDKFGDMTVFTNDLIEKHLYRHNIERESIGEHSRQTVINTHSKYKLPKLELQKFSGDPVEWLGWWSQFKGVHEDVTLSMEHKFQYLVQATVDKSSAHNLVISFPPTAENYPKAITYLKSRFGNDKILVEVYVRELLKLVLNNSINNGKNAISSLYDKLETQLRALESLGVGSDKYAAMLYPLVESALPEEILKTWQRIRAQTGNIEEEDELKLLMKFLRNEVDSEIRFTLAKTGISKDIEESIGSNSVAMITSNSHVVKVDVCYFCKKPGHIKPHCAQFKKWLDKQNQKERSEVNAREQNSASMSIAQCTDECDYSLSIGNLRANEWILDSVRLVMCVIIKINSKLWISRTEVELR